MHKPFDDELEKDQKHIDGSSLKILKIKTQNIKFQSFYIHIIVEHMVIQQYV